MLTNLLSKTLKDEEDPDRRLFNIIMIIAVSVLFSILINVLFSNSKDYKGKSEDLQKQLDDTKKGDAKTIDSLKDEIFTVKLDGYVQKDKFSKQLDSINDKLQKIR